MSATVVPSKSVLADPEHRKKAVTKLAHYGFTTITVAGHTINSCCGSRVYNKDGKVTSGITSTQFPDGMYDGTAEGAREVYMARYNKDWGDASFKHYQAYPFPDPRCVGPNGDYTQEQYDRQMEENLSIYQIVDKPGVYYFIGMSKEDAIKKQFPSEKMASVADGIDIEDSVDGKACLIWSNA